MNKRFRGLVASLDEKLEALLNMPPCKVGSLPRPMPESGIYLFSEGARHRYVGRSKNLRRRLHYHANDQFVTASFAFLLARKATGLTKATYTKAGSRATLQANPTFRKAFRRAGERIRKMDVRFIEESDPVGQALLEIFVALSLNTPYNKFETS